MDKLGAALKHCAAQVDGVLSDLLPVKRTPEARVIEAMRYASLGAGKRVRPFLLTQSAALFGVSTERAFRAAAAIEMTFVGANRRRIRNMTRPRPFLRAMRC